jgi:ABC-type dipeptide/oligopeptide/nickel transport system ATPase component/ABC-type dipeptide/oligopeptide/nickel transport system permease subunit
MHRLAWLRRLWRISTGRFGLIVVAVVLIAALVSLFWTPFDPRDVDVANRWGYPGWPHLLGTDGNGRDILSLLMAGARTTVYVAVGAGVVATVVGIAFAALGALTARWVRESVAVFIDVLIAFPVLIIAMMISAVWGGSLGVVIWSVGIGFGVNIARVTRPELRRVLHSEFVLAGKASGLTPAQNLWRHLLPNVAPVFIVQLSWSMAVAVLAEAGLSYLGFGAPVTDPSWGLLLADVQRYIGIHPLSVVWPGLAITLTVLGLNLVGDALRESVRRPTRRSRAAATRSLPRAARSAMFRRWSREQAARLLRARARSSPEGGDRMSLSVRDLTIDIAGRRVVDGVSFDVPDGARVGIIGESGSGKSLTALAIMGLLPEEATAAGSIRWNDRELLGLSDRELAGIRGDEIGIVFQEPQTALNPIRTVGRQIAEPIRIHEGASKKEAWARAVKAAERMLLPDPERIVKRYPHQLSGGQRQRVAIAMALVARPRLLIADEPTTALDVTIQAEILELLRDLVDDAGMSLVFITHDLAVLSQIAEFGVVLEHGKVVESAPVSTLLTSPSSPVTQGLLRDAPATLWRPEGVS